MTKHWPDGEEMSIYDAAMKYQAEGVPLVVFAGAEYGNGSSRDWAAKGTKLLGVRAVIAESFERIHRSNLVGMGVLPLTFEPGTSWKTLQLKGDEQVTIHGLSEGLKPRQMMEAEIKYADGSVKKVPLLCRIATLDELEYFKNGGILALRAAAAGGVGGRAIDQARHGRACPGHPRGPVASDIFQMRMGCAKSHQRKPHALCARLSRDIASAFDPHQGGWRSPVREFVGPKRSRSRDVAFSAIRFRRPASSFLSGDVDMKPLVFALAIMITALFGCAARAEPYIQCKSGLYCPAGMKCLANGACGRHTDECWPGTAMGGTPPIHCAPTSYFPCGGAFCRRGQRCGPRGCVAQHPTGEICGGGRCEAGQLCDPYPGPTAHPDVPQCYDPKDTKFCGRNHCYILATCGEFRRVFAHCRKRGSAVPSARGERGKFRRNAGGIARPQGLVLADGPANKDAGREGGKIFSGWRCRRRAR